METAEEPISTLATEEGAASDVEQPEASAAPESGGGSGNEPVKEGAAGASDLYALLTQEFEDAPDGSELDEVAKTITPETLKKADPVTRAVLRAVLARISPATVRHGAGLPACPSIRARARPPLASAPR